MVCCMAQWVGQQGSEALGTDSNHSIYLHIFKFLLMTWKIDDCFFSTPSKNISLR